MDLRKLRKWAMALQRWHLEDSDSGGDWLFFSWCRPRLAIDFEVYKQPPRRRLQPPKLSIPVHLRPLHANVLLEKFASGSHMHREEGYARTLAPRGTLTVSYVHSRHIVPQSPAPALPALVHAQHPLVALGMMRQADV